MAIDGATAVSGAWNAVWLTARRRFEGRAPRRQALATLAMLNGGIALEAAFAQAVYVAHDAGWRYEALLAPGVWASARAPMLAGVLLLSVLIMRGRTR
jgi:hypothetical protein